MAVAGTTFEIDLGNFLSYLMKRKCLGSNFRICCGQEIIFDMCNEQEIRVLMRLDTMDETEQNIIYHKQRDYT